MEKQLKYGQIQEESRYPFNPSQMASFKGPVYRSYFTTNRTPLCKVHSVGSHYIYGPSNQYSTEMPQELEYFMTKEEFKTFMGEVNGQLAKYWPCLFTFIIAYSCCILSCFISLMLPKICLDDVVKFLQYVLERWNETLNPRGVFVDWQRGCCGSYLEFSVKTSIWNRLQETKGAKSILKEETQTRDVELTIQE